jgi:hypothetical protein
LFVALTNIDKTRLVGGTENVNSMQNFLYNNKDIPSKMSTLGRQMVKKGQNLVNIVKECPPKIKNVS